MQADPNADVRGRMVDAGILIIDKHGRDNVSLLFPIFENFLNKKVSPEPDFPLYVLLSFTCLSILICKIFPLMLSSCLMLEHLHFMFATSHVLNNF